MVALIDAHREEYGVEPICAQLPMAPSTYYEHKARQADPARAPARVRRDRELESQIQRDGNQCTHSKVANSTASRSRQGPRRRITSVLYSPDDRFGQRVVVGVPHAAHRGFQPSILEPLGVANRQVQRTPVAVMNTLRTDLALDALEQALYERSPATEQVLVSINVACSNRSGMFHLQRKRRRTIAQQPSRPCRYDSTTTVSGKAGAVHKGPRRLYRRG
jgi:hypothetical protein